jgi:hypothetical protein
LVTKRKHCHRRTLLPWPLSFVRAHMYFHLLCYDVLVICSHYALVLADFQNHKSKYTFLFISSPAYGLRLQPQETNPVYYPTEVVSAFLFFSPFHSLLSVLVIEMCRISDCNFMQTVSTHNLSVGRAFKLFYRFIDA